MSNNSSSSSNDGYPSNDDSNWTTPDLDLVWLLPEEDLNAMLAAADQLQVDLNSTPAIDNTVSNDIVDPFGGDQEMLALLQDPQMLVYAQHAFELNLVGSTGGYMPSHAQHADQGMPLASNARGALSSSVNGATIASTGHQPTTTLPRFVDDDREGHLAPSRAGVQHAGTVPYYNGPPQGTAQPFGRQGDWTGLPTPGYNIPTNAYQQWGYGAGPVQQFGLGNANLQRPPPPPLPTYGPTTHGPSQLGYGTPSWQQAPPSFQGTRAPLTFAEAVNTMGFEAWAAQPPPRSVGFPDRARTRGRTGQRGRREPGAQAQTSAPLPGPSLSGPETGTGQGAPVADVHRQRQFGFAPQVPSAPGMAHQLWRSQPNVMPAPRDLYGGMGALDPAVHGRETLAAARPARDDADALQRPGPSRPAAESALRDARASQSAPRRQRPQPAPADEGSSSQAATTHGASLPAPDATPAVPPVESNSAAPRARGKKRARDEQAGSAPKKRKKARSAPAAAGPSTTQGKAL